MGSLRKGVVHGCQSLTKTVTGIALGAAMQEGILGLDDRLIDLFPEYRIHTTGRHGGRNCGCAI